VGVFASRTSAQAGARHLAGRAIVGEERPEVRPIRAVRTLPLVAFGDVCVEVLRLAGEAGGVPLGPVSTAGPTLPGKASRPTALSAGSRKKAVERVRAALAAWGTQASHQDAEDEVVLGSWRGAAVPAAWARRADRLATREAAMPRLEARAHAAAEAERPRRAAAEAARQRPGTKRRGRAPTEGNATPDDTAQRSCTAPELQRMPRTNTGGAEGGTAQVSVAEGVPEHRGG